MIQNYRWSNTENLINSEVEILNSWDLAMQVARASASIAWSQNPEPADQSRRLTTSTGANCHCPSEEPTILVVSYKNGDPELSRLSYKELVARYFTKHLEIHRSADAFNFVSQQSDEVRARLRQSEEKLNG